MADHVFDKEPPPPELSRAFQFKSWGVDLMELPAGELPRASAAMNAFAPLDSYSRSAPKSVEWIKRNPREWEFVSAVIRARKMSK